MTVLEALIQLRDDLKEWVTNNLIKKADSSSIGTLTDLTTTEKTSLVAAINEVAAGGGSGIGESDVLVVTADVSAMAASHSADEIKAANDAGKVVVLASNNGGPSYPFFGIVSAGDITDAVFALIAPHFESECLATQLVHVMDDKTIVVDDPIVGASPIDSITATVGQIAKVKTVDDSGKPTEWEAVDMPSGGTGGTNLPAYTEADYGKVLACTADGLVWVEQSGGSAVPSAEGVEF